MSERNINKKQISMADFLVWRRADNKKEVVMTFTGAFRAKEMIKETIKEKLNNLNISFDGIDIILNANGRS